MRTSSRNVAVLLFDEVELLDVAGPLEVLSLAGRQWNWRPFKVWSVARSAGLVTTRNQIRIEAAHALEAMPDPELILVPGGYGARRALEDVVLLDWLRDAGQGAAHVLGVGYGVLLLAKAGLLGDAEVAVPRDAVDLLGEIAPAVRPLPDARTHVHERILTASSSAASVELALATVSRILGEKQALAVAAQLGHVPEAEPLRIAIVPSAGDKIG